MDRVRNMFDFVKEIPVTFGPHWADEWLVWVTIASVAVSLLLAWLAFSNGRRASKLSEASEHARAAELQNSRDERAAERESARQERERVAAAQRIFEQDLRLDDAISEFFLASNRYLGELQKWKVVASSLEAAVPPGRNPDEIEYPPQPSQHDISASLETVLLRSKEDTIVFQYLQAAVIIALNLGISATIELLPARVSDTRKFRTGEITREEFISVLRRAVKEA